MAIMMGTIHSQTHTHMHTYLHPYPYVMRTWQHLQNHGIIRPNTYHACMRVHIFYLLIFSISNKTLLGLQAHTYVRIRVHTCYLFIYSISLGIKHRLTDFHHACGCNSQAATWPERPRRRRPRKASTSSTLATFVSACTWRKCIFVHVIVFVL